MSPLSFGGFYFKTSKRICMSLINFSMAVACADMQATTFWCLFNAIIPERKKSKLLHLLFMHAFEGGCISSLNVGGSVKLSCWLSQKRESVCRNYLCFRRQQCKQFCWLLRIKDIRIKVEIYSKY